MFSLLSFLVPKRADDPHFPNPAAANAKRDRNVKN
jgi:hypothetical protein